MVDNRNDRDADGFDRDEPVEGSLGGQAAPFDEKVSPFEHWDSSGSAASGLWSGLIAGAVMALSIMVIYGVLGLGFWEPMKAIAVSVIGPAALIGGTTPIMLGIIIQLAVSSVLGLVFAALFTALLGKATEGTAVAAGILYGLIVWIVAQFIILPLTFPLIAVTLVPWMFGLAHVVYGAVLGLVPASYIK